LGWPRILNSPVEPFDWSNEVSAWLTEGFEDSPSWRLVFGAVGSTIIVVRDSDLEDAIELAAGWLADNAPGHLTEPEYELTEEGNCAICGQDPAYDTCEHIRDAEEDLLYTESGWIVSYEWFMTEIDTVRTAASALSRALYHEPDEDEEGELQTPPNQPLIVYGHFWEVTRYNQPGYRREDLYFPGYWSEEQVEDVVSDMWGERGPLSVLLQERPLNKPVRWFVRESEEEAIYTCWIEPGDDPLGRDAVDYASAWDKMETYSSTYGGPRGDTDHWLQGARSILWGITSYRGPND
jgi:hypothetical protein